MRTDIGWLYLLAGASAVGAAVVYQRSKEEAAALPTGANGPTPGVGALPFGAAPVVRAARRSLKHVDLRGDELALALANPLRRLFMLKGITMDDRRTRKGWSPTDAEIVDGPRVDATIVAVGPGKGLPRGGHLAGFHGGLAARGGPVLFLLHPHAPGHVAQEILQAGKQSPLVRIVPLRDLPLGPDGITPSMATAAVWATDVARRLGA